MDETASIHCSGPGLFGAMCVGSGPGAFSGAAYPPQLSIIMDSRRTQAFFALSLGFLAFGAQSATAQETFGTFDDRTIVEPKEAFVPYSVRFDLDLDGREPDLVLAPMNLEPIALEDAQDAAAGSKVLRYGMGREIFADLDYGKWIDLDGESMLWTMDIVSEGALGVRALFSDLHLVEGAELCVFSRPSATSAKVPVETVAGPYTSQTERPGSDLWTPTRDGERLRIEMRVPKASMGDVQSSFQIKGVQHIYRDPVKGLGGPAGAGPCHNDVNCFPAYATPRDAVAGIGFVNSNSLFCTGQLLDAQNGDMTPYWLTANHCLSTQGDASTAEIFWLYQTNSCNGTVPSVASVPSSANCTLLATNAGSDFTLLMVNGTLPAGLSWAGWTAVSVPNGTASACVHHPSGDFKRISFGTKAPDTPGFVRIDWTNGPTEPGSSGSGVFRDDTKQLFGQLFGGPSACGSETNDFYGDFSTTYPSISGLLVAGSDDAFEPNDACLSAAFLSTSNNAGLVVKSVDEDWYQFTLNNGGSMSCDLTFTHAFGDIDLTLQQGCGGPVVANSESGNNNESISFTNNTGSAQTYFMRVWLFSDTRGEYGMDATITGGGGPTGPANDDCASATVIGDGALVGTLVSATNDGSASCGTSNANGDVWYSYTASCTGMMTVNTCGTNDLGGVDQGADTVLSIHSGCPGTTGNQLGCNDDFLAGACSDAGMTRDSSLTMAVTTGQNVLIRVSHWDSSIPKAFNLSVSCSGVVGLTNDACATPIALPGAFAVTAYDATGATTDGVDLGASCNMGTFGDEQVHNDVWFSYTPTVGGCTYISTLALAGYDTRLAVYDSVACPAAPGSVIACVDDEILAPTTPFEAGLDVDLTAGQTYLIRLGTYDPATAAGSGSLRIAAGPGADVNSGGNNPGAPGCVPAPTFPDLCNGDGGNQVGCTECPCSNNAPIGTIGGCLNSAGTSTRIFASGDTSASLPPGITTDLRFTLSGARAGSLCVMLSGAAVASQNMASPCFGLNSGLQATDRDGLRCAIMNTKRHGSRTADASGNIMDSAGPARVWGGEAQPGGGLAVQGGFASGQTRFFQVTHRDNTGGGCGRGLNTSQAVGVTFTP